MTNYISTITSLTHVAGQPYRKGLTYKDDGGNIKQSFPSKGAHRVNFHVIKDFQKDLKDTLTSLWGRFDTTLIAHPVDAQRDGDVLAERTSECMQTERTKSDIVMIDVDNVNGKDIIPVGKTLTEQLNNFMIEHFSVEMLQAKKVIKMSSSYNIKGSFKFHCYFKLKQPVAHGAWANYIVDGAFAHADKSLFNNSDQILFTAEPMGKNWVTKLKHNEPAIFTYEGEELFIDTTNYTPAPTKSRSTGVSVARLPNLKLKPLNSAIVRKIDDLDVGKGRGSRLKLFQAYLKMAALGYDVESWNELPKIEAQLLARQMADKYDDKLHYILSQPSYARQWVRNGCVDKFGNEKDIKYLPNHVDAQIDFKNLKRNNPTLESNLKALPIVLNWCKAPTGTGKTLGLSEFRKRKGTALITAPTLALVSANAKEFGRGTLAVNGKSDAVSSTFKGNVSTTMQSLHKLTYAARAGAFKVIVIDEAAQCLTALLGIANSEIKAKIVETLLCLFRHADYVVLCDADLTETVISNYGLILKDVELTHALMHVAKKQDLAVRFAEGLPNTPVESRNAYMYESTNEVINALSTSLKNGKRCLIIVNSKLLLQKLKRTFGHRKGHYYFCADKYGEPTADEFRDNPKVFVAARKPKLLACTQILKSGVSFIGQFDDVFVIDYGMNSTDRLIIQMVSRERAWRNAHIYVNNIDVAKTKAVAFANNYDIALTSSCNDTRDQLRIRAEGVAYRLAIRGVNVEFVNPKYVNIKLEYAETPCYCIGDGRDDYENYVFKLFNGSSKSSRSNIVANHKELLEEDGSILAIQAWVQGRPMDFYNWVQTRQILKGKMGTHFEKFGKSLASYGLCDSGYFEQLDSTYYVLNKSPAKLARSLEGYAFNLNPLKEASSVLLIHALLMKDLDEYVELGKQGERSTAVETQLAEEDIRLMHDQLGHQEEIQNLSSERAIKHKQEETSDI